ALAFSISSMMMTGLATWVPMNASTIRPGRALDQLAVLPDSTKEAVTFGITIVVTGKPSAWAICRAHQDLPLAGGPDRRIGARRGGPLARRAIAIASRTACVACARWGASMASRRTLPSCVRDTTVRSRVAWLL